MFFLSLMYHRYCWGQIRESFIMKLCENTYESTLRYVDQMCWIKTIIKLQSLCYFSEYPEINYVIIWQSFSTDEPSQLH